MDLFRLCPGYLLDGAPHPNRPSVSQEHLCDICTEVAEVDAQTIRTQNLLADLAKKRIALKSRRINRLHDPLSCLPLEIISQIFVFYANDVNDRNPGSAYTYFMKLTRRSPSLFLASICKGWRQIALATPELWTSIEVHIHSLSKIPLQVELFNQFLARSGKRPLEIIIFAEAWVARSENSSLKISPLFEAIRQSAMRWRILIVRIPEHLYTTFLGDLECGPALTVLTIFSTDENYGVEEDFTFHLPKTPSLTNLNISNLQLSQVNVQRDYLTKFHADAMSMDEVFELLRRAKSLLDCSNFTLMGDFGYYTAPMTPIVHVSLRKLDFSVSEEITDGTLEALFDGIELPSLDYLSLDCSESTQIISVSHCGLRSLFERSRCPLTQFSITNDMFDGLEILSILEILPTVTHVNFAGEKMMTALVLKRLGEEISLKDGTSQFRILPNRQSFNYAGNRRFIWRSLLDAFYPGWTAASNIGPLIRPSIPTLSTTKPFFFHFRLFRTQERQFDYIDANIVPHFARLQNEKFCLKIESCGDHLDLIEASLQYHRM